MAGRVFTSLLVACATLALAACGEGRLERGRAFTLDSGAFGDTGAAIDDGGAATDAGSILPVDAAAPVDAAVPVDGGPPDFGASPVDAGVDAGPPPAECHALLDYLGLDWSVAGASIGIDDPVRVGPMIDGVRFRYTSSATATAMLMDCSLAPRLVDLVALLAPYDVEEVEHLGIYNYRCIGGGDPATGCTPSMHAYAKAIDLHAFHQRGTPVVYSTETDWIISSGATCPGSPVGEEDRVLHEIACGMWAERIFQIVLTPDYNAAHRNHFHVDLTAGSMFVGSSIAGVDPPFPGLGD